MPAAPPIPAAPARPLWQAVATGCVLGVLLACAAEIARMSLDRNKHVVVPGRVYRSAQLDPAQLAAFVREHNIKTVVNLRGRPPDPWYAAEARATQELGVSQEDITTSAARLPAPGEVRRLIEVFDHSEHPILMHCRQGADRTGLAAAIYLLLYTDADYATARRQCSPRFGHVPVHRAAAVGGFFNQYEGWLADRGETHSPAVFRHWATTEYCPGIGRARLEVVNGPRVAPVGRPVVFTVRAHNRSIEPWPFRAGSGAGVVAVYKVRGPDGRVVFEDAAGMFDRTVPPGEHIDLALPVPALAAPGRHHLYVDLSLRHVTFAQYGSEALTHDWDARDPAPPPGP